MSRALYSTSTPVRLRRLSEVITISLTCLLAPHVGHLYTLVLADILKRWNVLLGRKSILVTGTDEHGMKVC